MQRYNSWLQTLTPDFWTEKFKPKDILRVTSHAASILSLPTDVSLLARYDINEINEHTVGITKVWQEFEFGEPTYLEDEDYPYVYTIDENWLFLDAFYDAYVDPEINLQNEVDFRLTKGKLAFVKEVPKKKLLLSKGRYAGLRIYNEIGNLLDYKRLDSTTYRDSIAPILAGFYLGPSPRNLLAMLNLVVGLPVAKYGNETVISIANQVVETDRYSYPMGNAKISVKEGDVLYRFQPLSNTVELITHKTHPYWWETRPVDLFAKYLIDAPMTEEIRDYIMSNFLYDVVAYIRLNLQWQDLQVFQDNQDILQLFYDALPTRTDIFLTQQYVAESYDDNNIMSPDIDSLGVRLNLSAVYGLKNIPGDMFVYSKDVGRPIFTNDLSDPLALTLNNYYWHIFDKEDDDNFNEFWKSKPNQPSYVELNYSKVYFRETDTPFAEHKEFHLSHMTFPADVTDMGIKLDLKGDTSGGIYSEITQELIDSTPSYNFIQGETVCGILEMDKWEMDNVVMAKDGLVVFDGDKGSVVSQSFPIGGIPKNIFARTEYDAPEGTLVDIKYSQDKTNWQPVPEILRDMTGVIYFKITMYALDRKSPTFRRLYVNLQYGEEETV